MKILSLVMAIGLGLAVSVGAQQYGQQQQQQQPTEDQQEGTTSKGQTTDQPAGPTTGHSNREQTKDTSKPAKMKSGGTATSSAKATSQGAAVQSTTVFRNGKQTSEKLSLHRSTRNRTDVHFSVGTHPRDWWLQTYSIVLISGCHYFLADDGCWYPAYGFDPSCNFPEGVVYCD